MVSTTSSGDVAPYRGQAAAGSWSRRSRAEARKEWVLFILFMLPNMVLFGLFTFWPMIENIRLSTQRWDMISPVRIGVGLANYRQLLGNDTFHRVLLNTAYFTVAAVGFSLLLGLTVALLLNQPLKFRDGARAIVFAPTLLSGAAIGIVWSYIFDPQYGLMAQVLGWIGLSSPDWLNRPEWAMPAIIIVYVWKNMGFAAVIFLAGLQAIPRDLYDAAKVDGANVWWRFRSVTIPMLSPITFFLLVTSILNTFQAFDIIRVMTQGGPVDATNTLIYYVYEQGFVALNAGRSAAASLVLFALMMIVTLIQLRFTEERVHYG
ncbi:MAG: sugar ABC transporter permease [Chloroflexota bacterium]|nr:sugar ABC transporter permease [Chloroflexota bacterium]